MANLDDAVLTAIKEIVQGSVQQIAQQVGQQIAEQQAKQSAQAIEQAVQAAKQSVQGSTQEKASQVISESKQEEINTGEAHRSNVYTQTRLWDFDVKQIAASEQSERSHSLDYDNAMKEILIKTKEVELARKEYDFAHTQKLASIELRSSEQAELVKHMLNVGTVDFRTAAYDPIAPNAGEEA